MRDWKENLTKLQVMIVRGFLTFLGMLLITIAFYAISVSEITGQEAKWTIKNYILLAGGVVAIWAAFDLGRLTKIVDFIGDRVPFKRNKPKDDNKTD